MVKKIVEKVLKFAKCVKAKQLRGKINSYGLRVNVRTVTLYHSMVYTFIHK